MKYFITLLILAVNTAIFNGCVTNVSDEIAEKVSIQDAKNFSSLTITDQSSTDLSITGWSSDTIKAAAQISVWAQNAEKAHQIAQELNFGWGTSSSNAELTVNATNPDQELGHLEQLNISAPSRLNLTLNNSSGNIKSTNMTGDINVNTSSGNLNLETTGHVVLKSSSGKIVARSGLGGSIDESSGSLDLEITSKDFDGVSVKTSSGDIALYIADGAKISFDLKSSSGSINLNYGGTTTSSYNGELRINVNGGGKIVNVTSSSGNINVRTLR